MRLRRGRWKNQKIIVVLGTLWIMGFAAWAFLLSDLLATSVNEGVLEGPREGVFWTAAQYRNVYTRFDRQLILYATHVDDNFDHVQMQLDSLSVSFGFLQRPSEVSEYWLRIPRARDEIAVLGEFMTRLKHDVAALRDAPNGAPRVMDEVDRYWPKVNGLANYFRAIEMAQRDFTFHQLKEKQRAILSLGIILGVILCALFLLALSARTADGTPLRWRLSATPHMRANALQLDDIALRLSHGDALALQLAGNARWQGAANASLQLNGTLDGKDDHRYAISLGLTPAGQHNPLLLALKLDGADNHVDLRLPPLALARWWTRLGSAAHAPQLTVPPADGARSTTSRPALRMLPAALGPKT